ncbi:redox-regulated ATPase YchF [bacterium]|nr:redox-regulated ATPase YchF [bacterium]
MKLGIIGLSMCGKNTLFEALTKTASAAESRMENRMASVRVPDIRIDTLSGMYQPKKTTYAVIDYFLPGRGVSPDEKNREQSVWNKVRDSDALIHVVRNFEGGGFGPPDPAADFRKLDEELIFADLVVADKRLERLEADLKKNRKIDTAEHELVKECKAVLDAGRPLRRHPDLASAPLLRGFTFLSAKPVLAVLNSADQGDCSAAGFESTTGERGLVIRGKVERELIQMPEADAKEFLAEYGITESAMTVVIRESYSLLGLMSFFTVGEDEVRAWTIRTGTKAVDAAEAIHSDIKKGFIRAEVVSYADLTAAGSHAEARKKGQVRLEGKEYVMQDGDVVEFRFNVGK